MLFSGKFTVYPLALNETPNKFCWATNKGFSIGHIDLNAKHFKNIENSSAIDETSVAVNNNKSSDAFEIIVENAFIKFNL